MAKQPQRNGVANGEDFAPGDGEDHVGLPPDSALVGDPSDGAQIIEGVNDTDGEDNWDLPENQRPRQRTTETSGDKEFDEEDSRLAYSSTGEEDDSPRGQSRRSRRNAGRRMAQMAMQSENNELRRQLNDLTGTVQRLVSGQQGLATNTLETQISTLQGQLRVVDEEMATSIKNSDGDTYQRAQRLRDEIVGRMYGLQGAKARMASQQEEEQEQGGSPRQQQVHQRQQQAQRPDPRVEQFFDRFCDRFDWFDPSSANAKSNIVRALDQELVSDGFQRHTPQFWQTLERRLSKEYNLHPNQAGDEQEDGGGDEFEDERGGRRERDMSQQRQQRQRPPTNGARSAGAGRSNGFRLNETQTNMLREEGLLEQNLSDEDKAKRDRIIGKWKKGAQAERRGTLQ